MTAITITDLNNAKLDVDHVAEVVTSPLRTARDRLGQEKRTLKGILDDLNLEGLDSVDFTSSFATQVIGDGVTDKSAALFAANALGKPLVITGVLKIGTPTTITVPIVDTIRQIFAADAQVTIDNGLPVRPEWWGLTLGCIPRAIAALPTPRGGVVLLRDLAYPPCGYAYGFDTPNTALYMGKANVSIVGAKMPRIADNCRSLVGGSIIQGPFVGFADNIELRDLGVDCGKDVIDTYNAGVVSPGSWGEALLLTYPDNVAKAAGQLRKKAKTHNVIGLSVDPSSPTHAVIIGEGYADVQCSGDLVACYGTHGVVVKCARVDIDKVTAYLNGGEGFICKTDAQSTAAALVIQAGKVRVEAGGPAGSTPYAAATNTGAGVMINPQAGNITFLQIGEIVSIGHAVGFVTVFGGDHLIDNMQIGSITTESNSEAGTKIEGSGNAGITRSRIGSIIGRNTPVALKSNFARGDLSVGHVHGVNAEVALDVIAAPSLNVGEVVGEACSAGSVRLRAGTQPTIGLVRKLGSTPARYASSGGGQVPTLAGTWTQFSGNDPFGASHDGAGIRIQGLVVPNGSGNLITTLPVWARPPSAKRIMCQAKSSTGGAITALPVVVAADGAVIVNETLGNTTGCEVYLSLSGISYDLAD